MEGKALGALVPTPARNKPGVPALECRAGTQQDAFKTFQVTGSAHNRIVSGKAETNHQHGSELRLYLHLQ